MSVFSKEYGGLTQAVVTDCVIFPENQKNTSDTPKFFHTTKAMWDTGATNTLISPKIIQTLKLKPFGKSSISSANGVIEANSYLIHVGLPSGSIITNILALENDNEDYEIVIGMDIITQGDFAFSNKDEHSTFSFRIPSSEEIILK